MSVEIDVVQQLVLGVPHDQREFIQRLKRLGLRSPDDCGPYVAGLIEIATPDLDGLLPLDRTIFHDVPGRKSWKIVPLSPDGRARTIFAFTAVPPSQNQGGVPKPESGFRPSDEILTNRNPFFQFELSLTMPDGCPHWRIFMARAADDQKDSPSSYASFQARGPLIKSNGRYEPQPANMISIMCKGQIKLKKIDENGQDNEEVKIATSPKFYVNPTIQSAEILATGQGSLVTISEYGFRHQLHLPNVPLSELSGFLDLQHPGTSSFIRGLGFPVIPRHLTIRPCIFPRR
jgi:hypothetical protein